MGDTRSAAHDTLQVFFFVRAAHLPRASHVQKIISSAKPDHTAATERGGLFSSLADFRFLIYRDRMRQQLETRKKKKN